jgi:hypothetical protein
MKDQGWATIMVTLVLAAMVSWQVSARFGARWAMILPLLALVTAVGLLWSAEGIGLHEDFGLSAVAFVFAVPALVGAGIGIVLQLVSRMKQGKGKP